VSILAQRPGNFSCPEITLCQQAKYCPTLKKIFMLHKQTTFLLIALLATHAHSAWAAHPDTQRFSFSGFGTIGMTYSDENNADFTSSVVKSNGAGYSREWSMDVDSRLGGQVIFYATPRLSGVVQLIAEQRYNSSYKPIVEWANIKYQVSPDFSVRVGRIALPNFLAADYRKVGYAIPWVRTPGEVYGLVPITNSDGVDANYQLQIGEAINSVQIAIGETKIPFDEGSVDIRKLRGIANTIEYGAFTARATYLQADLTIDVTRPLFDAFRQFGPVGSAIAEKYDLYDKRASFVSVGASYDPGNWFVMAEHGKIATRSYLGARSAWYASGGYRYGAFTPYVTYAAIKGKSATSDPGLPIAALPPTIAPVAAQLNQRLNWLLGTLAVQKSMTAGMRWDMSKTVALKVQYERLDLGKGSAGLLINSQPDLERGGSVNVVSAVLDFVF
jgi:hypothetical protein